MSQQTNTKKGFTIIEVVLVLAIAGLIFLMVFIALPALQRSQRDTQRRNDLSRVQTAVQSYQTNNRGNLPPASDWNSTFKTRYLQSGGDVFRDPNGTDYTLTTAALSSNATFSESPRNIHITTGAVCGTDGATTSAGARKVAVRTVLEGGGIACVNN